jgi:ABC-type uncharacterized transport system substrate-binding protein
VIGRCHVFTVLVGCAMATRGLAQASPPIVFLMVLAMRGSDAKSVAVFREGMNDLGQVEGCSDLRVERSNFGEELAAKRVQLLKDIIPRLTSVGGVHNITDPVFRDWGEETEGEIRTQALRALRAGLRSPSVNDMERLLRQTRAQGVEAIVVLRDFLTSSLRRSIATASLDIGLASVAKERRYPAAGALMSFGAADRDPFRSAARCVDRILKGPRRPICRSSNRLALNP